MNESLDKITIHGFKSIRELEEFELKSLNVLVGANGAGKSNFVSFFRMLSALMDNNLDDYVRNSGGISDLLFNGRKTTEEMRFITRFGSRGYAFKILPRLNEGFVLMNESRSEDHRRPRSWDLRSNGGTNSLLVKEATDNSSDSALSKAIYESIQSRKIYHFDDTSSTAGMRHAEIVEDNETLRSDAENIAPFLLRLREENRRIY